MHLHTVKNERKKIYIKMKTKRYVYAMRPTMSEMILCGVSVYRYIYSYYVYIFAWITNEK